MTVLLAPVSYLSVSAPSVIFAFSSNIEPLRRTIISIPLSNLHPFVYDVFDMNARLVGIIANTIFLSKRANCARNPPKVGDTITATVAPKEATNVVYAWAVDGTVIEGATTASYTVTAADLGKKISVTVTGDEASTATAETDAVKPAEGTELAIISAKQTGAKTVAVQFTAAVTSADKLTVKKGNTEVKIDGTPLYDEDFMGAVITLNDKITATEYTVTLTPADTEVAASSATFTGEVSELKSIEFMNDYLVMKDNNYDVGYCYIKGVDQFGGQVTLSGVTVTAGVGEFSAYDSATGRVTIDASGLAQANPYLLIKEVPVFVQYQEGNNVITANKNLIVSAKAYVNNVEFGEIKKDGTMRDDKKLTVTELNSGKYYLEFTKIEDQYENAMTADDLNTQKNEDKTLFVIPGDTGAFYTTGNFGTLNGKTILWITGATRPGTMALTITGAGGSTFTTDVTVENDPYIQTLSVAWPSLNAQNSASTALEFSAVDEYGDAMDLWYYKPVLTNNKTITFGDENKTTNMSTTVVASGKAVFNTIKENSSKKTFTITIDASACAAKDVEVFTITTAGMQVSTKSITVGEVGLAASVKSTLKSGANTQVTKAAGQTGDNGDFNFNKFVQFEDANGDTMSRSSTYYPKFMSGAEVNAAVGNNPTYVVDYKSTYVPVYYAWTLSNKKALAGTAFDSATTLDPTLATYTADGDGSVSWADIATNGSDLYVTVWGVTASDGTSPTYCIMDSKAFHLTKVTASDKTYAVSCADTLYVSDDSADSVGVKVVATTETGETYNVSDDRISLVAAGFGTSNNLVYGYTASPSRYSDAGTINATVYVNGNSVDDVTINYSKATPVATSVKFVYDATDASATAATTVSKIGATFTGVAVEGDEFTTRTGATFAITDGVLKITDVNGVRDTVYASIIDQYKNALADTKFYVDGTLINKSTAAVTGDRQKFQWTNGSVSDSFYLTNTDGIATINYTSTAGTSEIITSNSEFVDAIAVAAADSDRKYTLTVGKNMTISTATTIPANVKLTVPEDTVLALTGKVTLANAAGATLTNNGTISATGDYIDCGANSTINGSGVWKLSNATTLNKVGTKITTGSIIIDNTVAMATGAYTAPITMKAAVTAGGAVTFKENVTVADGGSFTETSAVTHVFEKNLITESGATLNINATGIATLSNESTVQIGVGTIITAANFTLPNTNGEFVTITDGTNSAKLTCDTSGTDGYTTQTDVKTGGNATYGNSATAMAIKAETTAADSLSITLS